MTHRLRCLFPVLTFPLLTALAACTSAPMHAGQSAQDTPRTRFGARTVDAGSTPPEPDQYGLDANQRLDGASPGPDSPVPPVGATAPAEPPAQSTPESLGYAVSGTKKFYIIGNRLTSGDAFLKVGVEAPARTRAIDLWIDGEFSARAMQDGAGFQLQADLSVLAPAEHAALLVTAGEQTAFASIRFVRSHPFYIFVSNDWDVADNDPTDGVEATQDAFHENHPELKITHFVGPYTFTDPTVTASRRTAIANRLKQLRSTYGDEIGLHIHPYCNFVTKSGVTCRTAPSFSAYSTNPTRPDVTGYTVILASYTEAEMGKMLDKADALFAGYGLGTPTSFRAGGWTADIRTLTALAAHGYVADASGANWTRLTHWRGRVLYDWNKANWAPVDDMSQPYYPSTSDIHASVAPRLSVLEVPDNGILVDYISGAEMVEIFDANWPGGALASPKVLSIGYHSVSLKRHATWADSLNEVMTHADQRLASTGNGPVYYVNGSEIPKALPAP